VTPARPSQPRLRIAATSLALAATLGAAGCTLTGVDAQTNQQYQAGAGANLRTGEVHLYNALAVDNGDGTATLSTVILNTTDETQKLDGAAAEVTDDGSPVDVETAPAIIGPQDTFDTGPAATVVFTSDDMTAGDYITITLLFDKAGEVSIQAPVVKRTAMYQDVATTPGG
jgi:hypothetical protein